MSKAKPPTRRGQHTRQKIIDTTIQLISQKTPSQVSLDFISSKVGVAKSSILWHFSSKEGLLLEVLDSAFQEFQELFLLENQEENDLEKLLRMFFEAYTQFIYEKPHINTMLFSLIFDTQVGSAVRERIRELYRGFRKTITENYKLRGKSISESHAALIIALVDGLFLQWFLDPDQISIPGALQELQSIL